MKDKTYYEERTKHPGKFQGEKPLTAYLWEISLHGDGEIISDEEHDSFFAAKFTLTGEEQETFDVNESDWVLIEDSQGFVFTIPENKFVSWKN